MARRTPFNEALLVRAATCFDTLDDDAETEVFLDGAGNVLETREGRGQFTRVLFHR